MAIEVEDWGRFSDQGERGRPKRSVDAISGPATDQSLR